MARVGVTDEGGVTAAVGVERGLLLRGNKGLTILISSYTLSGIIQFGHYPVIIISKAVGLMALFVV